VAVQKKFRLRSDQIAPLVDALGWCLATDRIMVDGRPIGYMYREAPQGGGDSGWRFFAGDEDDAYMANNDNHGIYDVNTVVNYDPSVIPYLDMPPGTRLDKAPDNTYVPVKD
jgi:hypothetical protein